MPSLSPKDRISLCLFSFTDGRRCRTPRISSHPHFCFYHAQKESQARSAATLGKDLAYFFSGDYLSACDLNTAFSRLIPAVIRGQVKPKLARTVAYMMQTLMQSIRLAQHEYINAFSTDGWRESIRNSVNGNHDYLFPPAPDDSHDSDDPESSEPDDPASDDPGESAPPQPVSPAPLHSPASEACHPERSEGSSINPASSTPAETHLVSPSTPVAAPPPNPATQSPEPATSTTQTPVEEALAIARTLFPRRRPNNTPANSFSNNIYNSPRNH
ncbi:MAG: hypothetical protein WA765_11590 [Candidatus Acidiferrum sp.]